MAVLRILAVSVLAAIAACAVASFVLFGNVDFGSFVALPFALLGSVFLLATAYAALKAPGTPLGWRYVALVALGVAGGTIMLGFSTKPAIGGFYGLTTALCWIALHALTRKRSRSKPSLPG